MDLKELINRNFSRKAEIVLLTDMAVILLCRTTDVDVAVLKMALVIVGIIGLVSVLVQGFLDWKHPKAGPDALTVSAWTGPVIPIDGATDVVPVAKDRGHMADGPDVPVAETKPGE